jgi:hypothetical protein
MEKSGRTVDRKVVLQRVILSSAKDKEAGLGLVPNAGLTKEANALGVEQPAIQPINASQTLI